MLTLHCEYALSVQVMFTGLNVIAHSPMFQCFNGSMFTLHCAGNVQRAAMSISKESSKESGR